MRMAHSDAATVDDYLAELSDEQRDTVAAVRGAILRHLPKGYEEGMRWGMIAYTVPLARYPDTYNGQPLELAGLAVQRHGYSLYLMSVYSHEPTKRWFEQEWTKTGKPLRMGKSCVRFKRLDDIPLELIGQLIARVPVDDYLAYYEQTLDARSKRTKGSGVRGKDIA